MGTSSEASVDEGSEDDYVDESVNKLKRSGKVTSIYHVVDE